MHVNWRWRGVALAAVTLFGSIYGVARPQPAAADPAVNATRPASSADSARTVPCRRTVYPLMPNTILLDDNPPSWYRPVTMASIGLSPDADETAIPGLNTITPNSPRFRINDSFAWVLWKSEYASSSAALLPMFMGEGTLSDGFTEYPGRQGASHANGVLEAGDWLSLNFDQPVVPLADLTAVLDAHIAAKTRMILPAYDESDWQDIGAPPIYRMQRLIEVRLLDYELIRPADNPWFHGYLEFALLDNQKVCVATAALFMPNLARR
jgi:hypothetical protein